MKNKNVYGIASTHSLKNVLIIGALLCIVQFGLIVTLEPTSLHSWIDHPLIKYSFLVGYMVVVTICGVTIKGSLSKITLNRLGIKKKRIYWDFAQNTAVSLIILWATQILSFMISSIYFMKTAPGELTNIQTIYLSSFRSRFFHMILPMGDLIGWFNIAALLFMSSVLIARYIVVVKHDMPFILVGAFLFIHFTSGINNIGCGLIYLSVGIYHVLREVREDEE